MQWEKPVTDAHDKTTEDPDIPDPETAVFETTEWPDCLFRADAFCPLPRPRARRRHPFTDWADL